MKELRSCQSVHLGGNFLVLGTKMEKPVKLQNQKYTVKMQLLILF